MFRYIFQTVSTNGLKSGLRIKATNYDGLKISLLAFQNFKNRYYIYKGCD